MTDKCLICGETTESGLQFCAYHQRQIDAIERSGADRIQEARIDFAQLVTDINRQIELSVKEYIKYAQEALSDDR